MKNKKTASLQILLHFMVGQKGFDEPRRENRPLDAFLILLFESLNNIRIETKKQHLFRYCYIYGGPKGIRTPDPTLRRRMLYPTELLTHLQMQ